MEDMEGTTGPGWPFTDTWNDGDLLAWITGRDGREYRISSADMDELMAAIEIGQFQEAAERIARRVADADLDAEVWANLYEVWASLYG